jgi:imidazolonepropionase-like amidohydrolase
MVWILVVWSLAFLAGASQALAAAGPVVAYTHGRWWSGAGFVAGDRYVRDGLFVPRPAGGAAEVVDLGGGYVVPPFADAHNHMAGRTSQVSDQAMAAGVFYLMNPTLLASLGPGIRQALAGPGHVDAVLSMGAVTAPGGHPEGLYENLIRMGVYPDKRPQDLLGDAFHEVTRAADIDPVLDRLVAQNAQFVKIILMFSDEYEKRRDDPAYGEMKGLDPALVPLIVQAAHRRGLRVAAHIETAADFRVIVAAGVDEAAHMPGYYGGVGPVAQYAITDADARAAARAHIRVVATASYALNNRDKTRLPAIQAMQRANLMKLKAAGVPILIGTDGVADAAIAEARYLVDLKVFTPKEAFVALAVKTPRFIFPGRRIGVLQPGYEASFLVLKADPTQRFDAVTRIVRAVKQGFEVPRGRPVASEASAAKPSLAIAHVSVLSMVNDRVARDQTILIAGARIAAIGRGLRIPPGVPRLDGRGRFAIPGLWDMHVHVLAQADGPQAIATLAQMLRGGVVGLRDMGSTLGELAAFRAALANNRQPLPDLVAAGPVVNGPATPWSRPIELHVAAPAEAADAVAGLAAGGAQFVKVYSGLDAASYAATVAAAQARGLPVAGHLPFAIDLQTAVAAGQRSIEHMEVSLSKSCGARPPAKAADLWIGALSRGGVGAADRVALDLRAERDPPRCAAVLAKMAAKPVWWTPTLSLDFADASFVDADFRRFAPPGGAAACQAAASAWLKDTPGDLRARALQAELDDVKAIRAAGVPLLAGTDMPAPCEAPVASLRRELALFVRAGLSPYAALRTATVEPAAFLGRADAGTLAPGETADIVLLAANPFERIEAVGEVAAVVKGGRVVAAAAP